MLKTITSAPARTIRPSRREREALAAIELDALDIEAEAAFAAEMQARHEEEDAAYQAEFDANNAHHTATAMAAEDAHLARINEVVEDADGERPDYKSLPNADFAEWKAASGPLFNLLTRLGMNEGRIEGARQVLGLKKLRSFKQLTPAELTRVRFAIERGMVSRDWQLAGTGESAMDSEPIECGMTEEEMLAIID